VHSDLALSRSVYEWVGELCHKLGAAESDQVPFAKYAQAAESLGNPSSVARAIANGATHIERVDRLVQSIAAKKGIRSDVVDAVVATVDERLSRNRSASKV